MRWVQFGPHGWVRINGLEADVVAWAHTTPWQGRRIVDQLLVDAQPWPPGVTTALLRGFPIAWLEAMVNTPEALRAIAERDTGDPRRDPLNMAIHDWDGQLLDDEEVRYVADPVPQLSRPDGTDPEGFYRDVAAAYNVALQSSMKPAAILAESAGVPVPTVHRWILEARRRGFLPPARKGRAG